MSRRITAALAAAAVTLILASGGASGRSTAPGQQLPKNQTLPSISGTALVPNTLTSSTGTWMGKGLKFAYQWLRCDSAGASCSAISGATGSAETLSTADAARTLRVIVTASNQNGSTAATSAPTTVVAQASSPPPPGPSSGTSPVAPSDSSLPVVSGTPQQNQTLSTSTGSWSGTTPLTYAYQWQRCGSGGGSCAPISGATAASYVLAAADVGSTLRASVTASNSAGSATASSDPTAVVSALPSPSLPSPSYYYLEHFDGAYTNLFWKNEGGTSFVSDGASGQALRVHDCASTATSHCSGSSSAYGQLEGMNANSTPSNDVPHTGRVLGSGSGCCDGDGAGNVDTWYRFKIRFPTGYAATPGFQNVLWELHIDDKTTSLGAGQNSTMLSIQSDPGSSVCSGSPQFCTTQGTNPRFAFQVTGGTTSNVINNHYQLQSLVLNRWYDIVIHEYFSADPTLGHFECWIDGVKVLDVHQPTLFKRSDGTLSYAEDLLFLDYRLWSSWASDVDYDEVVWGPTASSVGFTP
jgi:Polysaccharide lyase